MNKFITESRDIQVTEALRLINKCEGHLEELDEEDRQLWISLSREKVNKAFSLVGLVIYTSTVL